jgi:DNA polymerase-3 subunit epsilon
MLGLLKRKMKPAIDDRMPIDEARYVVVDTELTGLDENKDSIVSVGAVRMIGGRIDMGDTFYRLVSPRTELKAASVLIHEIMPSEVAASPAIDAVLDEFLEFCGDAVVVGHFITIDYLFLNRELKRLRNVELPNAVLDTYSICNWLRRRHRAPDCLTTLSGDGCRLYDIVKCFDIPVNGAHNAVMDAFITAQLFQRFLPLLDEAGVENIGDLLKIGRPFEGGDRSPLTGDITNF